MRPLEGLTFLSLGTNLPAPLAAAQLAALGALVYKVEPPGGDALARFAPTWYQALTAPCTVLRLDLKADAGQAELRARLSQSDLLLTSSRPAALARLGLTWDSLHERYPALCHVGIVGSVSAPDEPGHDLTYQAATGLVRPPALPRTLLADMTGAAQATSAALMLLLARERGLGAGQQWVGLQEAARWAAQPLRHGLTAPDGVLGGGDPFYGLYPSADGWVAIAALEPQFRQRLTRALALAEPTAASLAAIFRTRSSGAWGAWARAQDVPLVGLPAR